MQPAKPMSTPTKPQPPHPPCTRKLFESHRLRFTRQRACLYEALAGTTAHPTADELFRSVASHDSTVSLATVYNALEAFCDAGLARKIASNGGPARYDAAVHHHLHVRDQNTGAVADVPDPLGQSVLQNLPQHVLHQLEEHLGFKIDHVQIEFVGRFQNRPTSGA